MHAAQGADAPVRRFETVCAILDQHGRRPERLIPILQAVQAEYRYLPEEVLTYVAVALRLPPARVYGVATFYSHFALEPKGRFVVRVCDGTACHVKGSTGLVEELRRLLNLGEGQSTTPDMMFTLETVSCIGACGLAPAITVNDEVHGMMTPSKLRDLLEGLRTRGED